MKKTTGLERGQAGIAGEYAVMSELIFNGFAAGLTGGNSREIDILCRDVSSGKTTNIQVKTQAPETSYRKKDGSEFYSFLVGTCNKKDGNFNALKRTIIDKKIHYAFHLARNNNRAARTFIATPEEVVSQLDDMLKNRPTKWFYFRLAENETSMPKKLNCVLRAGFESEKGWNKLR